MKNKFFINLRLIIEFYLLYSIYIFIYFLPINFVSKIGGFLFRLFGPMTKKHKIVLKNLQLIFPLDNKYQITKKAGLSWINTGKTFFELLILKKIINSKNKIKIEGKNFIKTILLKEEKAIFIGIHQSNWEILLPSIDKLGINVGGIYRHINNTYINNFILNIRKNTITKNNSFYTPKGIKSAKEILVGIKKNKSIILLIDQKDSAGEIVPFFKFPAKTQIGFIKIAKKHNLKIIPIQNIRNKDNTFTIKFHKPIEKISTINSDIEIMEGIHHIIEDWILANSEDWFLQHNRFN